VTSRLAGQPVRAVLLDYGGTLTTFRRPDGSLREAYAAIHSRLIAAGFRPPPADDLVRDVHDRVEEEFARHLESGSLEEMDLVAAARRAYRDLGLAVAQQTLDEFLHLEQLARWHGVSVDPDAVATLAELRSAGLRLGLCSNAPYRVRSMAAQVEHFGLAQHLDAITFSAAVGWRKPDGRIYAAALAAIGAAPSETVMVGDSEEHDIAGAHRAGLRAVLYRRDAGEAVTEADAVIRRLAELPLLLGVVRGAYTGGTGWSSAESRT